MRLLSLRLRNFRQHADTEIAFRSGLTGVIGANGAGKTTILEAIAWAIYGAQAARGTNDTIRFSRAGPRSRVEVELGFALGGHEYRVVRTLNQAEVFLDGSLLPVASSLGGVTEYLHARIGMTREEFFNTYFTGQKELAFLAAMGPSDRGRFLSQVLGYERLRRAQELARARRNELRSEIRGLRATLGDPEVLAAARVEAERALGEAVQAYAAARRALEEAEEERKALEPKWAKAQEARERFRELTHAMEAAAAERENAQRDVERARAELETVAQAQKALKPLRMQLKVLPQLSDECDRLAELARQDEQRRALARQLQELEKELARGAERQAKVESAPELERKYAEELEILKTGRAKFEAELEEKRTAWLQDRQDAAAKLQFCKDRGNELRDQVKEIQRLGPEGTCPTCGRPLGKHYESLLEELRDQLGSIAQDAKWWTSRFEQIQDKPADVAELEAKLRQFGVAVEDRAGKLTRCQAAVQELEGLRKDRAAREARKAELAAELEAVPAGYDAARHREAERQLRTLREVEKQAARLEEAAGRAAEREKELKEARARDAAAEKHRADAAKARDALRFSEDDFARLKAEHEGLAERCHLAGLDAAERKGAVRTAEVEAQGARRAEDEYRERARELGERETDLRHHEELDGAFTELRNELNDQVRPELSEIGSLFLAQLTDGRYTAMEIDAGYNLMVLDEGEEKPVISGGEEDIANLVLRLSLSQMIAERAGHPLSLLILDEVFGSLDVARRDNVLNLLHHLEDRFEQVILITHIEGIREGLDQVLRVEFDERAGTSVVREEVITGGDDYPEAPMAAD
ncbi:MAG TPA: SMC family ATPase [Longimicrobiaceae bacterium]|nr:SMC family ATPase [Longimicrobiaceae bacterium]